MLSAIGLGVGIALSIVGLLDLFLSPEQIGSLNVIFIRIWNELEDVRRLPFSGRLHHRRLALTAIGFIALLIAISFYNSTKEGTPVTAIFGFSAFLLSTYWMPRILAWTKRHRVPNWALLISLAATLLGSAFLPFILGFAVYMMTISYFTIRLVYFGVLYICASSIGVLEFALRRVAEYPKGAVAAAGILLGFVSSIIKISSGV